MSSLLGTLFMLASLGAWLTHIVTCISTEAWMLLFMGALIFPVGIIHGVMVWFGMG